MSWGPISQLDMRLVIQGTLGLGTYPSTPQSVQVTPADTAADDLDIDVGFLPGLGLELLPDHVALGSSLVKAHPAFELVVGRSHCDWALQGSR